SEYYINQSEFLPRYKGKIVAIPCGINPEEMQISYTKEECREKLSLSQDDLIVLFVGHLINYKSPNLLIEALPLIIENKSETRLVIVGEGPMLLDLVKLADHLKISDRVSFPGRVSDNLKKMYYKAADIFVLPSTGISESFGNVILEAAVAGLPIIASSLETFRAFIEDGHNGIITKAGDINSLANAINLLISQPALRQTLGENAQNRAKAYARQPLAKKLEELYRRVLKGA
ncbi:MAG: glycosyltransferase family 4 protein, partial [Dehalococcoidia bacterium]